MKPINFAINFALAALAACLILFELALFFELWEKPEWGLHTGRDVERSIGTFAKERG